MRWPVACGHLVALSQVPSAAGVLPAQRSIDHLHASAQRSRRTNVCNVAGTGTAGMTPESQLTDTYLLNPHPEVAPDRGFPKTSAFRLCTGRSRSVRRVQSSLPATKLERCPLRTRSSFCAGQAKRCSSGIYTHLWTQGWAAASELTLGLGHFRNFAR